MNHRRSRLRHRPRALRAAALLLAGACTTYRPVPTGGVPRPSARVRELTGELASTRGDMLDLRLRSVNRAVHPPARVRVVPTAGDRLDVRRFDWDRSGLTLILGVAVGAYFLFALAFAG